MGRIAIASLVACAAGALFVGTAVAGDVKTSVTLKNPEFGVYSGKVKADNPCRNGRTVEVWHDTNGNGQIDGEPTDFKIGQTKSKRKGLYRLEGNQAPPGDNIIAVVKDKEQDGGRTLCEGAVEVAKAQAHAG
jgi:hypothetical protein